MKKIENALQRQVASLLEGYAWPAPRVLWTHFPAGEKRPVKMTRAGRTFCPAGARLKRDGLKPGWPDFQVFSGGRGYFLELKKPGGRLSGAQRDVLMGLIANGFETFVADNLWDAAAILAKWGVLSPAGMRFAAGLGREFGSKGTTEDRPRAN